MTQKMKIKMQVEIDVITLCLHVVSNFCAIEAFPTSRELF